jgi:hypothetical protein
MGRKGELYRPLFREQFLSPNVELSRGVNAQLDLAGPDGNHLNAYRTRWRLDDEGFLRGAI